MLAHPSQCAGTVDPASLAWHSYATMKARVRVVLAEDSYLVREGVRRLLETDPDIELTSCCVDLAGLLAAVERDHPEVVVTASILARPSGGASSTVTSPCCPWV